MLENALVGRDEKTDNKIASGELVDKVQRGTENKQDRDTKQNEFFSAG